MASAFSAKEGGHPLLDVFVAVGRYTPPSHDHRDRHDDLRCDAISGRGQQEGALGVLSPCVHEVREWGMLMRLFCWFLTL